MDERNNITVTDDDTVDLLDLLIVVLKRKRIILGFTFGLAFLTAIISLIMPEIYKASAKIFPVTASESGVSQLLGQLGGMAGISMPESKGSPYLYVEMLKSNTILDEIIKKFNLKELYDTDTMDDTREALLDKASFSVDKQSNIITISVYDCDPSRSAKMANFFVDKLIEFTNNLALTEASKKRVFFEKQLKEAFTKLQEAESRLAEFQSKTGILKIDEQTKALIEAIATFKAKIVEKEVELQVLSTFLTPDNPRFKKLEEELRGLKEKLREFEEKKQKRFDPLISAKMISSEGLEYLRRMREVKFNETLYSILLKQYEAARLEEAKEKDVIQVIDRAIPPEKRAKPKRTLMVLIAAFSGFFVSLFFVFVLEFLEKAKHDPESGEKVKLLKMYAGLTRK